MALSRRGILFSPSIKDKRIEDYFKLPASMRIDDYNKENKKSIVKKIVKAGKALVRKGVRVLGELLFPKAQINFFPREFKQHDANATYIFPFFEDKTLLTPTVMEKKPPPSDLKFVKLKKSKCSSSCQTDSVMFEDIEKSPFFTFNTESAKSIEWKFDGYKSKLPENIENHLTDSESLASEMVKIKRKVIKKVKRSNLSIVNCENLDIPKIDKEVPTCSGHDQFMLIDNDNSSTHQFLPNHDLFPSSHPDPDANEPTTKKSSFFPPKVLSVLPDPQLSNQAPELLQSHHLNPALNPTPTLPISIPETVDSKPAETNPFLNSFSIKKTEPSFVFGSAPSTPATVQKHFLFESNSAFPPNSTSNPTKDVEMAPVSANSLFLPAQINLNTSIQTPNLEVPQLFTQNNVVELFNKPPQLFPVLNQSTSLFTLPSEMKGVEKPQFSICNSNAGPQSTNFSLGKIASFNKKK